MKKIFRMVSIAALAGAALLTGCTKDYGVEISELQKTVAELQSTVGSLKSAIEAGAVITAVDKTADGVKVTLNNNQTFEITNGKDGAKGDKGDKGDTGATGAKGDKGDKGDTGAAGPAGPAGPAGADGKDGKDGIVYTIGADGYWYADGVKTDYVAVGKDGKDGKDGQDGKDGKDGKDGQDGKDGKDGKDGQDGQDGKDGVDGDFWIIKEVDGVPSFVKVNGATGKEYDPAVVEPIFKDGKKPVTAVWDTEKGTLTLFNVEGAENNTVTISLNATLASIVAIPQFYYGGIEALYYHYLAGVYQTVSGTASGTDAEDQGAYSIKSKNAATPLLSGRNQVPFNFGAIETAQYHVNPEAYKFETEVSKWGFDWMDRDYVEVRATTPGWTPKVEGVTREKGNVANVKFTIANADKLNPSTATQKVVSVLSLFGIDKTDDNKTVSSDYAAVVATKEELNHLAFTKDYTAETCNVPGVRKLYDSAAAAAEAKASVKVKYDKSLALDFVGVHVEGDTEPVTLAQLQAKYPNLDLKYELIDYTLGSNVTSENAFGVIEGKTFFPAHAETTGTSYKVVKNTGEDGISSVGRRPIVLVTLVDTANKNNIVLAGYFKIQIAQDAPTPRDPQIFKFDIKNFGTIGYSCQALGQETKWYDMSYQILEDGLSITFNDFRSDYAWEADKTYYLKSGADATKLASYVESTQYGTVTYVKDDANSGELTGLNDIFKLAVDKAQAEKVGVGKTQTLYARFNNTETGDVVFIGLTFTIGDVPAVSFIKKNPVYWYDDLNAKYPADAKTDLGMATVRNNVRVPIVWVKDTNSKYADNSDPVTKFDKDIDDDWLNNVVKIVKAGTTTEVAGATYKYRFSADNKNITVNGKKWVKLNDNTLQWDGTTAVSLTADGVVTFEHNDKTKQLINWATNPQEKAENPDLAENLLYCNVDIVAEIPSNVTGSNDTCELLVEQIHVRFLRPVYLKFDPQENHLVDGEATGSRVPFGSLFSARDWQNYPIFSYNKTTKAYVKGYYPAGTDETTCSVDWYDYYGFEKLVIDLDTVETDQSGSFQLLKTVNPAAIVGLIDPANPTAQILSGKKEIDIKSGVDALEGWMFWYANNMGYANDFQLKVKVELTYSWGSFSSDILIPVWGTKHNYQD